MKCIRPIRDTRRHSSTTNCTRRGPAIDFDQTPNSDDTFQNYVLTLRRLKKGDMTCSNRKICSFRGIYEIGVERKDFLFSNEGGGIIPGYRGKAMHV
jgi:hypothetical protein